MVNKQIDFDLVREIALELPDVEETTIHGAPSLKVRGRLLACPALHKSAEPNTLAVKIDFERRDELIAADPETYYLKDHYLEYPVVLVRLNRVHPDALRELLLIGWRHVLKSARQRAARTR